MSKTSTKNIRQPIKNGAASITMILAYYGKWIPLRSVHESWLKGRGGLLQGERKMMSRFFSIGIAVLLFISLFSGCSANGGNDIIVLFTNDVHCGIDEDIGYAGLAAYKKSAEAKTPYTVLVDCGDSVQGDIIGTVSRGEYPAKIMDKVGYDLAVLGNHEFDYGMERLAELMEQSGAEYLACNIGYLGEGKNAIDSIKSYSIKEFGKTKVAFIGICTPETVTTSTPSTFMNENGEFVYDFYSSKDGSGLYDKVQQTVDECKENGADYVIALAHLGTDKSFSPFCSIDVAENTTGIDVILDGHSHSVIPCQVVRNKNGNDVLISSTGTKLNNIGQLVITPSGNIMAGLISDYQFEDNDVSAYIQEIKSLFETDMERAAAKSEIDLPISENGIRIVRSRETGIGNLCADAFRVASGADIALINGGGIRADLHSGEIKYGDIISVMPYGNSLCCVKASGQEILDALEAASRDVKPEISDGESAVGENGGFLQVSGLKYTIDTSIPSTVELDENGMFISVDGKRRVKDVLVLVNGEYTPIVPDNIYTVASHNYLIKEGGDGLNMFTNNELVIDEGMIDSQVLITYINEQLSGIIPMKYGAPQGRITII